MNITSRYSDIPEVVIFDSLAKWNRESAQLAPQPDELVLFDIAANAAATVGSTL